MILDTGFGHRGLEEMTIAIGFIDAPRLPDLSDLEPAKDVGHQLQMILVRMAEDEMVDRSGEHTSELQSLMRISYAVFCLKKKNKPKAPNATKETTQREHYNRKYKHTT